MSERGERDLPCFVLTPASWAAATGLQVKVYMNLKRSRKFHVFLEAFSIEQRLRKPPNAFLHKIRIEIRADLTV